MSRDEAVAGFVRRARQLHAQLRNERRQQLIQQLHQRRIAVQLVRTVLLDRLDAVSFTLPVTDAGKTRGAGFAASS